MQLQKLLEMDQYINECLVVLLTPNFQDQRVEYVSINNFGHLYYHPKGICKTVSQYIYTMIGTTGIYLYQNSKLINKPGAIMRADSQVINFFV